MNFSSRTKAITVAYNPDLNILRQQLESLNHQCETIIIDNCSEKNLLNQLYEYCNLKTHVLIISLDRNTGISSAQNTGIKYVLENTPDSEFVLLLDHDSVPSFGMVNALEKQFDYLDKSGRNPAAIGPLLYDPRDRKHIGFHSIKSCLWRKVIPLQESGPIECHSLNSSGSLISLKAMKAVGLLEKDFFMDHGETEWCFRALNKGYRIFGSSDFSMIHHMGDDVVEFQFFGKRRMPYRSPLRHYYIMRNSIHLQKKPYVPLTWKFWNVFKIAFTFVYFGFFSRESGEQRKYIIRGIRDGFQGITGEFSQNEAA